MILPNALLIGVQKAGTTSLYDWIAQHQDVYAPQIAKDYPFFVNDHLFSKGIASYSALFDSWNREKIILAGNVNIIYFREAVQRINTFNPGLKLILMLRNPADRAFSAYRFVVQKGLEKRSFKKAIAAELKQGQEGASFFERNAKHYVSHGFYFKQLKRLQSFFSANQIFIGLFDDIVSDKGKLIKDIFEFLGVDSHFTVNFTRKNETAGGYRSNLLNHILYSAELRDRPIVKSLKEAVPAAFRFKVLSALERFNKKPGIVEEMDAETKGMLTEVFREDILKLQDLIGRDLSHWLELRC